MEKENKKNVERHSLFLLNLNMGIFKDPFKNPLSRDEMQFWRVSYLINGLLQGLEVNLSRYF